MTHVFWLVSRSAGIVALLAASASVGVGLLMGGGLVKRSAGLRPLHEALAVATMAAIVLHAGSLLFDSYLSPSLAAITIPFVGSYRPLWTSLGIVCGWLTLALGLSYYARARIGVARWRRAHQWTAVVWLASLLHALGEGTDAGRLWFLAAVAIVAVPALLLLLVRHLPPTPHTDDPHHPPRRCGAPPPYPHDPRARRRRRRRRVHRALLRPLRPDGLGQRPRARRVVRPGRDDDVLVRRNDVRRSLADDDAGVVMPYAGGRGVTPSRGAG